MTHTKQSLAAHALSAGFGRSSLLVKSTLALAVAGSLVSTVQAQQSIEEINIEGRALENRSINSKMTAPILDTPKSVSILPASLLEERGVNSLVDALKSVPGISFNAGEGGQPAGDNLKIRGFDAGADVFVDGVRDAGSQSRDVFALEQVEVLMGPSSAYGGRGSAGGAVNLATKRPRLEDSLSMRLGAGNEDFKRISVDGNKQLGTTTAARLNVMYNDGDVPGRDSVFFEHKGVAPSLAFGLGTATRFGLDYYYFRTDDMPDYSIPYSRNTTNTSASGEPVYVNRDNFYGLLNRDFQKTGSDIGTVTFEHDFSDNLRFTNTTRFGESSNDYVVTNPDDGRGNVYYGTVLRNTKNRNSETETKANQSNLRGVFELGGMEHSFSTGLEFSKEEMHNRGYTVTSTNPFGAAAGNPPAANSCSAPGAIGAASNYNCTSLANPNPHDPWVGTITPAASGTVAETDTKSAYFFDTVSFSERWQLNLGVRFDDYETTQTSGSPAVTISNDSSFWNHQLGLVFKPADNGSIYISTGTSSNPSGNTLGDGTENLSAVNADLDPERNRSYELGTKWAFAGGRLNLQSSLFQTTKENARVAVEPGSGAPQQNVGEQEVRGIELSINGQVTQQWNVMAGYTYLDSEIVDDGPIANDQGHVFPNTPENSFNLWTSYDVLSNLSIGGGVNYVDKRYGNAANTVWIPSYTTVDLMASWQASEKMGFQLNVQNATNEDYFTRPYSAHYASIGPARSVILSFGYAL
ncbi:MAG TPA: TonB-dependent siderophore receptor [Hyphomicrobiales bacterium]|nr:TonB-dependent siderophore receptor [Hyphomicrobiales bacterium]